MKGIKVEGWDEEGKLLHVYSDADGDATAVVVWKDGTMSNPMIKDCTLLPEEEPPSIKDIKVVKGEADMFQIDFIEMHDKGYEPRGDVEHHVVDGRLIHCVAMVKVGER